MRKHRRSQLTLAASAAAALATAIAVPIASAGDPAGPRAHAAGTCAGTFQVLHNDHIGKASFRAGAYKLHTSNTSCSDASKLFARFLQDFDGKLPDGWFVTKIDGDWGFRQKGHKRDILPKPVERALGGPTGALPCVGSFDVANSVKVDGKRLRAGRYQIKQVNGKSPSCTRAADVLSGKINGSKAVRSWKLKSDGKTLAKGGRRFQLVNRKPISGSPAGSTGGYACRGDFQVVHNGDTIAGPTIKPSRGVQKLRVPRGFYRIVILSGGRITCSHAVERFKAFLNHAEVSKPWKIQLSTATFYRNPSRDVGFRVEPTRASSKRVGTSPPAPKTQRSHSKHRSAMPGLTG